MLTRRQFLGRSAMAMAGSAVLPSFLARAAMAAQQGGSLGRYGDDTILVVIQMSGGNDGLNTVVPYGLDGYYQARPNLGIDRPGRWLCQPHPLAFPRDGYLADGGAGQL